MECLFIEPNDCFQKDSVVHKAFWDFFFHSFTFSLKSESILPSFFESYGLVSCV